MFSSHISRAENLKITSGLVGLVRMSRLQHAIYESKSAENQMWSLFLSTLNTETAFNSSEKFVNHLIHILQYYRMLTFFFITTECGFDISDQKLFPTIHSCWIFIGENLKVLNSLYSSRIHVTNRLHGPESFLRS